MTWEPLPGGLSHSIYLVNAREDRYVLRVLQPAGLHDTTEEAQKAGSDKVIAQSKAVVTIESIDAPKLLVKYRTEYNQQFTRVVSDKRLLEGLRPGDRVEVTMTEAGRALLGRSGCLNDTLLARSGMAAEDLGALNQRIQALHAAITGE